MIKGYLINIRIQEGIPLKMMKNLMNTCKGIPNQFQQLFKINKEIAEKNLKNIYKDILR